MATAMTFASLKTDVARYLERGGSEATDPTVYEQIPRLINLAERKIARALKVQGFQVAVTGSMQAGNAVIAKPDRWRDTVSISIGTGTNLNVRVPIFGRDYEYCRSYWPDDTQLAQPEFYADYDYQHWLFAPTPDQSYPFEILYYELPPLLDDSVQENWLTQYAPQVLLYGTLLEATAFLKNDERIQVWQQYYGDSLAALNAEDMQKVVDRSGQRREV